MRTFTLSDRFQKFFAVCANIALHHKASANCRNLVASKEFADREFLWNYIERTHKNRMARSVIVAMPMELSDEQNIKIAKEYAKTLKGGDIVLLNGEMGAGKTLFTKGIAEGLGITDEITSPTYAYMNDYDGKLYHYDCYRLSSGEDAEALGLTDYFYMKGICLIEWSQNIEDVLPKNCKRVQILKIDQNSRKIIL